MTFIENVYLNNCSLGFGYYIMLIATKFVSKLRQCLAQLGYPANQYSGHSFRRGGASLALQCGLPVDLIKFQGDWNSNAYERYLEYSFSLRQKVALSLRSHTFGFLQNQVHWMSLICDLMQTDLRLSHDCK